MSMKLYNYDDSELMVIHQISRESSELLIEGVIAGAMPIRAKLKPEQLRVALKMMSFKDKLFAVSMLFRRSK